MGNRSNIIYFFISLLILYGVYYLYIEPQIITRGKYIGSQSPELQEFMSEITASLGRKSGAVADAYIINRAETEWLDDPFYDVFAFGELMLPNQKGDAYLVKSEVFTYSGYVATKSKKIAIISNKEYEVGETLDSEAGIYALKEVGISKAVIENKALGTDITVFLPDFDK